MEGKLRRLGAVARDLNIGKATIVDFLRGAGFMDINPNSKLDEIMYGLLVEEFAGHRLLSLQEGKMMEEQSSEDKHPQTVQLDGNSIVESASLEERYPVGTILLAKISLKIEPGTLVLDIANGVNGTVSILDLAWNLARAEQLFSEYNEGDQLKVVVEESTARFQHLRLSVRHLLTKPSESEEWSKLKLGTQISGEIVDQLTNGNIVKLENGLTAICYDTHNGNKFTVLKKDSTTNLVVVSSGEERNDERIGANVEEQISPSRLVRPSSFDLKDTVLSSLEEFKQSLLFGFADEDEKEFLENAFRVEQNLFSRELIHSAPIHLKFEFGSPTWETFESQIVPGILNVDNSDNTSTKKAIKSIEQEKFWIRINKKRNSQDHLFSIYNEKLNFHGLVTQVDDDACHLVPFAVAFGKKNSMAGKGKKSGAQYGSFQLSGSISICPPSKSLSGEQSRLEQYFVDRLRIKHRALEIYERLRLKSGEIMRSEGEALQIFDKFLEYQEDYTRKNQPEPIALKGIKRTHGVEHQITWTLPPDVEDYFGEEEGEVFLDLREKVDSTKKDQDFDFQKIGTARAIQINESWKLMVDESIPLDEVKALFIQKKASVRQFQVQREIIRDFFDKKLRLDHIENLLVRPERIKEPDYPEVKFENEFLRLTEKEQSDNNQLKAVRKAVGNKNIFLVQGPPGTGKTTVIAEVIKQLVDRKEKILVAGQTHIAVDNVLEKLCKEDDLSLIRLGNKNRVLDSVKHFHTSEQVKLYTGDFQQFINVQLEIIKQFAGGADKVAVRQLVKEMVGKYNEPLRDKLAGFNFRFLDLLSSGSVMHEEAIEITLDKWKEDLETGLDELITPLLYGSVDVVFATCIGIKSDREFTETEFKFDTVIIDEAGKANLAESLVAVSMAKKVILVGDQMQLPPYIDGNLIDPEIKGSFTDSKFGKYFVIEDVEHALKTSFFEFLVNRIQSNEFPNSNLEMLNYQHRMHPNIGQFVSESFYDGRVNMGSKTRLNTIDLPEPFDREVTFINTGSYSEPFEKSVGFSAVNETEAATIVQNILPQLMEGGLQASEIAVIAPYKSQVALIKEEIENSGNQLFAGIEVATLDSFQGMEFDVVIFSFTRSAAPHQENQKVGFLDDARRLNVAFSRAKKKLILIGNSDTLRRKTSHFDRLFDYTQLFRDLVTLSRNPEKGHYCDLTDFKGLKSAFERFKEKYAVGSVLEGSVKVILDFGIIVTVDGQDGLVHKSNFDISEIKDVSSMFEVNQKVKVMVTKYDNRQERISFGIKQIASNKLKKKSKKQETLDEWQILKAKHAEGQFVTGKVKNVLNYGVFVKLSKNFDGLVHISQLDPAKRHNLVKNYPIGSEITSQLIEYKDLGMKISLSESMFLLSKKK